MPNLPSRRLRPRGAARAGFTLIELLIVVVIIGILAAIAIPKFTDTKGKSYATSMKADLRNLASRQEDYFYNNEVYSGGIGALGFSASPGVVLTITQADASGWSATTTHPAADPLTCAVFYGGAAPVAPATVEGVVECA
jgi:type IV pilus assembly protein PilA